MEAMRKPSQEQHHTAWRKRQEDQSITARGVISNMLLLLLLEI
jgi:hypothetical protein